MFIFHFLSNAYFISANSFRGTIIFWIQPYVLWPLVTVHTGAENYSREETIQGPKLYEEIRYVLLTISWRTHKPIVRPHFWHILRQWLLLLIYRFSSYSFRGNSSFLNSTLCTVTFGNSTYRCGIYSREGTIQGRKLYEEIRYEVMYTFSKVFTSPFPIFFFFFLFFCQ